MKKIIYILLFFALFCNFSVFAQITSASSGDWTNTGTWVGGVVPISSHNVVIAATHVININDNVACNNITFNAIDSKVSFNTANKSLSVGGNLVGSNTSNNYVSGTNASGTKLIINGSGAQGTTLMGGATCGWPSIDINKSAGTFTLDANLFVSGNLMVISGTFNANSNVLKLDATNNVSVSSSASLTNVSRIATTTGGTGAINIITVDGTLTGGNLNATTVTVNSGGYLKFTSSTLGTVTTRNYNTGSTVEYGASTTTATDMSYGGNLTISSTTTFTAVSARTIGGDLTISGTSGTTATAGRLTWSGSLIVNGNLLVNSNNSVVALYPSYTTATITGTSGKSFTVTSGSILRTNASTTTPLTTQYPSYGIFDIQSGSTIEYYKTATSSYSVQDQYYSSTITYSNLKITHAASSTATITVTINSPSISTSFTIQQASSSAGAFTYNHDITFANSSTLTIPSLTMSTSSIAATMNQTLIFGAQPVIVSGNVSITNAASSATATSTYVTLNAGSLTVNGNLTLGSTGTTTPYNTPYILLNDPASSLIVGGSTTPRSLEQTNGNIKFTNSGQTVTFNGACTTANGNATSETFNFNGVNPTINFNGNFSDGAAGTTFSCTGTEVPVINFNNGTSVTPMTTTLANLRGAVTVNGYRQVSGAFRTSNGTSAAYSMTIAGTLNLQGNNSTATNTGGGTNTLNGSGTIKLTGDYGTQISGYSTNNFQGTGTLHFAGSSSQTIPTGTYNGITVENSAGLTLGGDATLNGILSLTSGLLTLGANNLTLGASATIGGTPSATNMIVATGSGQLIKTFDASNKTFTYPIGDATKYTPVYLAMNSADVYGTVGANLTASKHGSNASTTHYINRYWTLTPTGFTNPNYDATFSYDVADIQSGGLEANLYGGKYDGATWTLLTQANAGTHSFTGTGLTSFSVFTAGENSAMPVTLTTFTINTLKNGVVLNWKTSTETQNSGWEIERRQLKRDDVTGDTENKWEKIGFINGSHNSNSPKSYSYTDKTVYYGQYEYRLKQIDLDGTISYSETIKISVGGKPTEFALHDNYPNPFNPSTKIRYSIPTAGKVTLNVYNSVGQLVTTLTDEYTEAGVYEKEFDGKTLSSGVYIYTLTSENVKIVKKMLLIK